MRLKNNILTHDGFTMVELMVVVIIIGVLSVLAVTGFNDMIRTDRINQAAQQVANDIRNAQYNAETRERPYQFTIVNATTYQVQFDSNNDGVVNGQDAAPVNYFLATGIIFTNAGFTQGFNWKGTPTVGWPNIGITDDGTNIAMRVIYVRPVTGKVGIRNGP